uniref:Bm12874, isoform b n=1 Tax=Brugia malayi TaxID=6279 RepID=A0A0J9Y4S8_BRUMA|nr:Bm12874, isoform b [Brugia malayi]
MIPLHAFTFNPAQLHLQTASRPIITTLVRALCVAQLRLVLAVPHLFTLGLTFGDGLVVLSSILNLLLLLELSLAFYQTLNFIPI